MDFDSSCLALEAFKTFTDLKKIIFPPSFEKTLNFQKKIPWPQPRAKQQTDAHNAP